MSWSWLCWHKWSGPDWQMVGMDSWYWYRRCLKCAKKRKIRGWAITPPIKFIHGVETIISLDAYNHAIEAMRDQW